MTTTELARYQNGNCTVTLYSDGTKVREWPDGEEPCPEMPESVDLKITNWCDGRCPWCAEESTEEGKDASLRTIEAMLEGATPGMEVAIGGGNPIESWVLHDTLDLCRERRLIANITINAKHARKHQQWVRMLHQAGPIHGIGLSYQEGMIEDMKCLLTPDTVVHLIAGIHRPEAVLECLEAGFEKILVLGCKQSGRMKELPDFGAWIDALPKILRLNGLISFDNLALEQLRVRDFVDAETWRQCFMGRDGQFTMFLDAVTDTFAVSSRHPRLPRAGRSLREMFSEVRRAHD